MESIFESSYLFDPTHSEESTPFLSFSSLAGLSSPLDSWDAYESIDQNKSRSNPSSDYTSSPTPSDPFQIVYSAFEPSSPAEYGIFHTPSKIGSTSKIVGLSSAQVQTYQQRSNLDWDSPVTPSLTAKSSCDSFSSVATGSDYYLTPAISTTAAGFAWDEASSSLGSSSLSPKTPTPHRVASNPTLGNARHPKAALNRASMPSLKEEEAAVTSSPWLDGTETAADVLQQQTASYDVNADTLADDLDWVFGDHGLSDLNDSSLFSAFVDPDMVNNPTNTSGSDWESLPPAVDITLHENSPPADFSWLPELSTQDVDDSTRFDYDAAVATFTINPAVVMNPVEEEQRPLSAPGLNGGEGSGMLSVPMGSLMSRRTVSSDGYNHPRNGTAPTRDLFAYTPQVVPTGPPVLQPLYTSQPQHLTGATYQRSMPLTPTATKSASRRGSQQLSIQINPPSGYSTYASPSPLPPTPQSATFPQPPSYEMSNGMEFQPIAMNRAGTQPLPVRTVSQANQSRRMSVNPSSLPTPSNIPAHLARAQAVVQMHENQEESERQELRRQASIRKVGMAQASVMQHSVHRPQPAIMGWEGPSSQTGSLPVLTSAPLVTIHPPQPYYFTSNPHTVHRVHPPPHPGVQTYHPQPAPQPIYIHPRPMAPLPSPKSQTQRAVTSPMKSPTKRTPSKTIRKASNNAPGNFSWGETTFINFTSQDAEKLLTGVAPSGSQSKRRREEDAARMAGEDLGYGLEVVDMERSRSKRSRSGD